MTESSISILCYYCKKEEAVTSFEDIPACIGCYNSLCRAEKVQSLLLDLQYRVQVVENKISMLHNEVYGDEIEEFRRRLEELQKKREREEKKKTKQKCKQNK